MKKTVDDYEFSDDKSRLQLPVIHQLLKEAYWCKGIPQKTIAKAIEHSLCFGIYKNEEQVGFARVVTDGATFAWICDVIIADEYRGRGLAKGLMNFMVQHPSLLNLRRICLATKDAHGLYQQFGFKPTETPQNWLEIKNNNIYL